MKHLIVTADDFGLAPEVNEAVETAHRQGILTSASLMVAGDAASDAVTRARRLPGLRIGLHLVLVEGRPVSSASIVPDLVGRDGCFRRDLLTSSLAMFAMPGIRRQLATEIAAQFESFLATGLELDHVDAHKHFHLHPTISTILCRVGARYGMRALRAPVEPAEVLTAINSAGNISVESRIAGPRRLALPLTRRVAARLARRLSRAGIVTADQVFGLAWSGALVEERLAALLAHLPDGVTEIYSHPATSDYFAGAARGYRHRDELHALISRKVAAAVARHRIVLTTYSQLCAS